MAQRLTRRGTAVAGSPISWRASSPAARGRRVLAAQLPARRRAGALALSSAGCSPPAAPRAPSRPRTVREHRPQRRGEEAGLLQLDRLHRPSEAARTYPTLEKFQEETGITVTYNADVNDNDEFFAQGAQPARRLRADRPRHLRAHRLDGRADDRAGLDPEARPRQHAQRRRQPASTACKRPPGTPTATYSVPWQSGLTGIAYNAKYTDEVGSFEELLTRADLKGKVSLLTEMRDTMGFMLLLDGADPDDFTDDEWAAALDQLEEVVDCRPGPPVHRQRLRAAT